MRKFSCLIIDDEMLARTVIKKYLLQVNNIEIVGECQNGFEGVQAIQRFKPDLIFLDVQMPKLSGLEMLELIENPPMVIFITAYHEHAVKAFEMNAMDYLLKPFSKDRFFQTIAKIENMESTQPEQQQQIKNFLLEQPYRQNYLERIVVRTIKDIKVIPVQQVMYLETQDDYVMIHTRDGKYLKQQTMKYFDQMLDPRYFIRIHRSFLISIQEILRIEPAEKLSYQMVLKNLVKLPISRSGYTLLKEVLDF